MRFHILPLCGCRRVSGLPPLESLSGAVLRPPSRCASEAPTPPFGIPPASQRGRRPGLASGSSQAQEAQAGALPPVAQSARYVPGLSGHLDTLLRSVLLLFFWSSNGRPEDRATAGRPAVCTSYSRNGSKSLHTHDMTPLHALPRAASALVCVLQQGQCSPVVPCPFCLRPFPCSYFLFFICLRLFSSPPRI